MARPLRIEYPGAFYHVTCRGNGRANIFFNDGDRQRFLMMLEESIKIYRVILNAYILMDNHFHLLVQTERANLSEFMRRFNVSYTGWFNYRHDRCGHLYQGRYKAFLIDVDSYLLEVSRYLHLNSVRARSLHSLDYQRQWQYAKKYKWSSLPGYISKKRVADFIKYDMILEMVGGRRRYQSFILDGLKHDIDNPFEEAQNQVILGGDEFIARIKSEYTDGSLREQPSYRDLMVEIVEPELVMKCATETLGIERGDLQKRYVNSDARGIVSDLLYRYSALTQVEIGKLLGGIDYTGVSKLRVRLRRRMSYDKRVSASYEKTEAKLKELSSFEI
ncbi:transposase [candidate division WOR-3 bacterium]|nr:transposase [candidate division WOR-3 bacterium]